MSYIVRATNSTVLPHRGITSAVRDIKNSVCYLQGISEHPFFEFDTLGDAK